MDFSSYGTLKKLGEDVTKSLNAIYVKFWNVYGIEKMIDYYQNKKNFNIT